MIQATIKDRNGDRRKSINVFLIGENVKKISFLYFMCQNVPSFKVFFYTLLYKKLSLKVQKNLSLRFFIDTSTNCYLKRKDYTIS